MSHGPAKGAPIVAILEGPFHGSRGPVVGIDQQKGTVQVRIPRFGVVFGPKHTTVEIDVRKVRRLTQ